jgi:hypothetical protein
METIYRIIKSKVIVYSILIFFSLCACKFDGEWEPTGSSQLIHYTPTFYQYNIAKNTYTKIASLPGANIMTPHNFLQYQSDQMLVLNDNRIIYVHRHQYPYLNFQFIDINDGSVNTIDLDSLGLGEGYVTASPVEHKIAFFAGRKNVYGIGGLYVLDLDTRKIKLIKSINSTFKGNLDDPSFIYSQPSFSHDGQFITYVQEMLYMDREHYGPQTLIDYSICTIDLSNNQEKKICHSDKPFYYPLFDQTDEHIYATGISFRKVTLESGLIETIDNRYSYAGEFEGLPPILITGGGIFYSLTNHQGNPQDHEIYYYNAMLGKSTLLTQGLLPMSESPKDGNILIRANCDFTNPGSAVKIINTKGAVIRTLRKAMWASYYPDGENILLLIMDQ